MKIAQLVCSYPPYRGGMGRVAEKFHQILLSAGRDSSVICPAYRQEEQPLEGVLRLRPWLSAGNGAFLPQLAWSLGAYDIVHLHYPFFGGAEPLWLAKKLLKQKFTLAVHFHMQPELKPFFLKPLAWPSALIEASLWQEAKAITCASLDYAASLPGKKALFRRQAEKCRELPFSVDTGRFLPKTGGQAGPGLKLLFVGGMDKAHYFKGVPVLLDALSRLKDRNWSLELAGGGDRQSAYIKLAKNLEIGHKTRFLGGISDEKLIKSYQDNAVLVLPSVNQNEAFGLVLLEAMSAGLALIASRLPGVRTVFRDGQEGFFFRPNDAADLAAKITAFLDDPGLAAKMSRRSRQSALDKYDERSFSKKLLAFYENLPG